MPTIYLAFICALLFTFALTLFHSRALKVAQKDCWAAAFPEWVIGNMIICSQTDRMMKPAGNGRPYLSNRSFHFKHFLPVIYGSFMGFVGRFIGRFWIALEINLPGFWF